MIYCLQRLGFGQQISPEGNGHQAEFTRDNELFIATDRDWRVTYVNRKAAEYLSLVDLEPADLLGHVIWRRLPFLMHTRFFVAAQRAMAETERRDDLRRLVADVQRLPEQQRDAFRQQRGESGACFVRLRLQRGLQHPSFCAECQAPLVAPALMAASARSQAIAEFQDRAKAA